MLLAGVFCTDYPGERSGVYVRLWNDRDNPEDLATYVLEWDGVPLLFPAGPPALAPGASAYVAWDAEGAGRLLARAPDYCVAAGTAPRLVAHGGAPQALRAEQGSLRLLTPNGAPVDAFAWGGESGVAPGGQGVVYQRAIREETLGADSPGRFVATSGAGGGAAPWAAAWRQGTDWLPRRLPRPGQSALTYPTFAVGAAELFVCPDSSFEAISRFVDGAERTLTINLYLFTQALLAERVEAAIRRGVAVRLLMEGEPYEGMPPSDRETMVRLQTAGAAVQILKAAPDGFRRYRWVHAKYAVADERRCLVLSDNWTNSSAPGEPVTGQRGWGIIVESADVAGHLLTIFADDANPASPDCVSFVPQNPTHLGIVNTFAAEADPRRSLPDPIPSAQVPGPVAVTLFTAPDHALLETRAICGLMRSARQRLEVQQNAIQLYWGLGEGGSVATMPNLFLAEVVAAARRGVPVRVLLDGSYLDPADPRDNGHTRDWLTALAQAEGLPLEARILDRAATGMGIHNKGLLVDGEQVLLSSVNWSQNSPLENRELGLILTSPAVAAYFQTAFDRDWAGGK